MDWGLPYRCAVRVLSSASHARPQLIIEGLLLLKVSEIQPKLKDSTRVRSVWIFHRLSPSTKINFYWIEITFYWHKVHGLRDLKNMKFFVTTMSVRLTI